ncbi:MAG: glycerate kinase type-2 family protein [Gemmatimonadales bacterium]
MDETPDESGSPDRDERARILRRCYDAAVRAVQPQAALGSALQSLQPTNLACWIIAVGKAAGGMAKVLTDWLETTGRQPAGGIVVAAEPAAPPHPALRSVAGDHPIAGARSAAAAQAIADVIERIPERAEVHVAISGGTTALIAGPLPLLTAEDVSATFKALLSSGLDIREMNAIRKRVTRWSAGRLAAALAGRTLHVWVISDVPGNDLGSIGSGPCTGDPWTAAKVREMVDANDITRQLPASVVAALSRETPKPDDPALRSVIPRIVADNGMAINAALAEARDKGLAATGFDQALTGEAAAMGATIAGAMLARTGPRELLVWGGETTVTIHGAGGKGGRSQELALSAARLLDKSAAPGMLLAAGTDGRDGPTDAAGAFADRRTWRRIASSGRDSAADLAAHESYAALDAAGALLRTGPTGTNVSDLALAITR